MGGRSFYARWLYPLLARVEAESAHEATLRALEMGQSLRLGRWLLARLAGDVPAHPVSLFGLTFPNPLGLAAGFDKDARVALGLACLGFGHVEVGTLTPRPQPGNPRPRLFRLPEDGALINRMGFPNQGTATAVPRLQGLARRARPFVLGVSLGKQKETPLAGALEDYRAGMRQVFPYADYLALNVSSPNTPGLRQLQGEAYLGRLLAGIVAENQALAARTGLKPRPLLLKIAPDLDLAELDAILDAALAAGVDGIIATNTTVSRAGLRSPLREQAGGLSGRPLAPASLAMVRAIVQRAGTALPVVAVGGIDSAAGMRACLEAGASLVQLYTALVFQGPGLAGRLLRELYASPPPAHA